MNQTNLLKTITLTLTVLVIVACTQSMPVREWSKQGFSGKLDNILVIAVTSQPDRRRDFEDKFVAGLADLKVKSIPSYVLIDSSLYLSRKVVENAIKGRGMGGVLVMRLAGVKEKEIYRPPDNQDENMTYFKYYDNSFKKSNEGSFDQHKVVTLETNFYDTRSGDLVWSMQSETMDPSQPGEVVNAQIELTIKTLANRGLI